MLLRYSKQLIIKLPSIIKRRSYCETMSSLLKDFPPGPLDYYRKKASFDWKKLKTFIDTEEVLKYKNELYELLEKHPEYQQDLLSLSFDEERRKTARQAFAHKQIDILTYEYLFQNLKLPFVAITTMMQIAPSSAIKHGIANGMFVSVLFSLGSERHQNFLSDAQDGKIYGCFCLTEIAHGSNTKGMRTTATYDKEKKQFILNTPDFEAAKCWAGSLGQTATHAIVYAQLYVDEKHYGLHPFIVQIRDTKTLLPLSGILVGDMGEKIGLNGIDNGFLIFKNHAIPKDNLLNKTGDVSDDGKYVTRFKTSNERYGAAFGALSSGRVNITGICEAYGTKAVTIAIRYAAVRKQFGPDDVEEIPILEYQTHQHRLLPFLGACYAFRIFSVYLLETQFKFTVDTLTGVRKPIQGAIGMELHGISSASKPVAGWLFRDAIQESRESCAGHGYLKVAGLGDIRNENDANCTYEGENHVLIQQTSNWLLKYWPQIEKGEKISSPLQSIDFLTNYQQILNHKFTVNSVSDVCCPKNIIDAYQWLTCYYLRETKLKYDRVLAKSNSFNARNEIQVYYAKNLAIVYIQQFVLQRVLIFIQNEVPDDACKKVLLKLFSLYGLWYLERFLPTLYEGGYVTGSKMTTLLHEAILQLCNDLKNDAVALVDVIAPPDFILNSALGASDGEVYKRLESAMLRSPYAMSRPTWWQEIVCGSNIKNKL